MTRLNLNKHQVGEKHLYGPGIFMYMGVVMMIGDIEGHRSMVILSPNSLKIQDGRFYVCDFGRLFPPEAPSPQAPKRGVFFRQLRPEVVQLSKGENDYIFKLIS